MSRAFREREQPSVSFWGNADENGFHAELISASLELKQENFERT